MKSLAFVVNKFPPCVDGVADYTFHFAHALAKIGIQIMVICSRQESVSIVSPGIQVFPIIESWSYASLRMVGEILKEYRPDAVFLQYVPYAYQRWGLPYALIYASWTWSRIVPLIVMFHEIRVRWHWNSPKTWVIAANQAIIANCIHFFAKLSFTSIEFYQKYLPGKTILLPVGSNIHAIKVKEKLVEQFSKEMKLDEAFPILVTFGIRDLNILLNAFSTLKKSYPSAKLLICGKAKDIPQLEDVLCLGYRSEEELAHIFKLGQVFIVLDYVSSNGEGGSCNKSGAIAAGLSSGIPLLGTQGDMNNALLKHGENVWLSQYTPEAILQSIQLLLNDQHLRNKLAMEANSTYIKHLHWDAIREKFTTSLAHLSN